MNYAEDRLDRRSRYPDGVNSLWNDYQRALMGATLDNNDTAMVNNSIDHELLGRTLRDIGWNYHALYHYGQRWCLKQGSSTSVGDYSQMAELTGYPDIGAIALLAYYHYYNQNDHIVDNKSTCDSNNNPNTSVLRFLKDPDTTVIGTNTINNSQSSQQRNYGDPSWLLQDCPPLNDCGCGYQLCGSKNIFIPMIPQCVEPILQNLDNYSRNFLQLRQQQLNNQMDANELLRQIALFEQQQNQHHRISEMTGSWETRQKLQFSWGVSTDHIPMPLQFWTAFNDMDNNNSTLFPPVLQLLLVKLLYLVIPSLSIEAVVQMTIRSAAISSDTSATSTKNNGNNNYYYLDEQYMAKFYKSHWAYYIFVRSLVFGERIKPHRKQLQRFIHIPLWDTLWGVTNEPHVMTFANISDCQKKLVAPSLVCPWKDDNNMSYYCHVLQQFLNNIRSIIGMGAKLNCNNTIPWIPPLNYMILPTNNVVDLSTRESSRPIFIIGDSHILSLAWQTIRIPTTTTTTDLSTSQPRLLVPVVTTGIKAWHIQSGIRFFTHSCLHEMVHRVVAASSGGCTSSANRQMHAAKKLAVVISAGEIDCREGMGGPLLAGYTQSCVEDIQRTVHAYVQGLDELLESFDTQLQQILVMPVAPHAQTKRSGGRITGQESRRETMDVWNNTLRTVLPHKNRIFFLDYSNELIQGLVAGENRYADNECNEKAESIVLPSTNHQRAQHLEYILSPVFNADSTHLNNAFLPHFVNAIVHCGCNLSLL